MQHHINLLTTRYPELKACQQDILKAYLLLEHAYAAGHKLLVCGNGGSAADAEHIVGELMKSFVLKRKLDNQLCKKMKEIDELAKASESLTDTELREQILKIQNLAGDLVQSF